MATRRKTTNQEQLDLIDVTPENAKPLKRAARAFKAAQTERKSWGEEEEKQKNRIVELVHEAGLKPDSDGVITFTLGDFTIKVTARELVNVKMSVGAAEEDED
jgi:hypothetical protein